MELKSGDLETWDPKNFNLLNNRELNFRPVNLALGNSLVLWEILQNIQSSQELLQKFRLVAKLWNETAVRVLHRRKSIVLTFRYFVPTREFYLFSEHGNLEDGFRYPQKHPLEKWTLNQIICLLQESEQMFHENLPFSRFTFQFRDKIHPFGHSALQKFLALYGKHRIRELRISFPDRQNCWAGDEARQIKIKIPALMLRWTLNIETLILDEFASYSKELDLESQQETLETPPGIESEKFAHQLKSLILPQLQTLVLNKKLPWNSELVQKILQASPQLQVIKNMAVTPEIPGALGATSNIENFKKLIFKMQNCSVTEAVKFDPSFDLRLDKLKLPGVVPPLARTFCPRPCEYGHFPNPGIEFEKHLQLSKQIFLANRETLQKLKLTSTLYYYPDLESLPKMDHVTFFQMPVKESVTKEHCDPMTSLAKWLIQANFPSLRHFSIIFQDRCNGCYTRLSSPADCSFFNFLQPLKSVKRLDISGVSCGHQRGLRLDKVPQVFPVLKTLNLNSLLPQDFPALGLVLWKITSLEKLELEIVHGENNILKTFDVDSAFTGLSEESLEKVVKIMMGVSPMADDLRDSCFSVRLLKNANVTRGSSILDLKELKTLDLKLIRIVDYINKIPESVASFAPLTGILALSPMRKRNGTRIRVWTKHGWSCHPWNSSNSITLHIS